MGFLNGFLGKNKKQEIIAVAENLEQDKSTIFNALGELFVAITENEKLKEKIGFVCSMDFFTELQPLTSLNNNFTYSLDGNAFAGDGCGGYYILLQDTSIGYVGFAENECGRVAMNLKELLELELNCAYSWHNYGLRYAKLDNATVLSFEETGKEEFEDAYSLQYNTIRDEISKALNLYVTANIYNEILTKLSKAATLEPKFTAISDEGRMNGLIM